MLQLAMMLALASQSPEHRMTTGSGIRARAEPKASAAEVVRLPIGSVLLVKEKSAKPETIGGVTEHWYRVELSKGTGWIFGGFLRAVDPANAIEAHLALWRERSTVETTSFAERADLAELLMNDVAGAKSKDQAAELELAAWRAMKWAVQAIVYEGADAPEPFKKWIEKQGERVVYSEPGGVWYMSAVVAWRLADEHQGTAHADEIAWEAATTPYPGECEGSVPCLLTMMNRSYVRYLDRFPRGKHAEEAMKHTHEALTVSPEFLSDLTDEDKKDMRAELAKIRKTLAKVDPKLSAPELAPLANLDAVAR
jgi:hypothetical protein